MNISVGSKVLKNKKPVAIHPNKDQNLEFPEELLDNNLKAAANTLQIDLQTLSAWLKLQQNLSSLAKYTLLRAISEYELNPFNDEIILIKSKNLDQSAWPFITVDGWIKLINKHPQFCGIEFTGPYEEGGKHLEWMECAIYRNDRIKPITIREYLVEVVTDQAIWKDLPNRMLRHRTMAQCAKLAFGICVADAPISLKSKSESRKPISGQAKFKIANPDRVSTLKKLLNGANNIKVE